MSETNWPTSVAEAVNQIVKGSRTKDLEWLAKQPKEKLIHYLHSWGTGIRNSFGLWQGNEALLRDCRSYRLAQGQDPDAFYREHGYPVPDPMHPDDASMVIIEAVWARCRELFPEGVA